MSNIFALFLLVFGLIGAIWPYEFARFGEQLDAIGSKRSWSDVEPADWNVTLTRVIGVALVVVGVLGLLSG